MFAYLKTGLAIILGFVGSKMILLAGLHIHVPTVASLTVIISVLAISIIASVIHARHVPSKHMMEHADGQVRVHTTKETREGVQVVTRTRGDRGRVRVFGVHVLVLLAADTRHSLFCVRPQKKHVLPVSGIPSFSGSKTMTYAIRCVR